MGEKPQNPRFTLITSPSNQVATSRTWSDLPIPPSTIDLVTPRQPGSVCWLNVVDPTGEEVDAIAQAFSIHPLTVEDVALKEQREKVEVFRNYYFISFRTLVVREGDKVSALPRVAGFYILVFPNGAVTFSPSGCKHVERVRERMRRLHDPASLTSDWICYALIDDIVDSLAPHMDEAQKESEVIEDTVLIARTDDIKSLIPRVDDLRKKISHLIRTMNGKIDVLNGFVKRCQATAIDPDSAHANRKQTKHSIAADSELTMYLGDVQDHLVTMLSNLVHFDEIVGRSQANCLAQLSATNLRISININEVMSKVTVLATIFVPLHLITGLFGMNVEVPGQEAEGLAWFFGIVGVFVGFIVLACWAAARFRLL